VESDDLLFTRIRRPSRPQTATAHDVQETEIVTAVEQAFTRRQRRSLANDPLHPVNLGPFEAADQAELAQ